MRRQKKGFSVVLAIIVTAFLTIVSAGVLDLVLREMKTSSAYWHGVATQAGAEGSVEWALLKMKNHREGFEDKVVFGVDRESLLLSGKKEFADIGRNDQILEYEILARSGSYAGNLDAHGFDVLPLFFDSGAAPEAGNAAAFDYDPANMSEATRVSLTSPTFPNRTSADLVWNIVGTRVFKDDGTTPDVSGDTDGVAGTGAFESRTDVGVAKKVLAQSDPNAPLETSVDRQASLQDFMARHTAKYLVVYNYNALPVTYTLTSDAQQFALPAAEVLGSSTMGDFKQTLSFTDSRQALFSGLKYSLFSAQ